MAIYEFPAHAGQPTGLPKDSRPAPSAGEIRTELQRLGLARDSLGIEAAGDTVLLTGKVPDAATHERVLIAVGNMPGVAAVDDRLTQDHYPSLLDALSSFAHLPPGTQSSEMAERMVHEARAGQKSVLGPAGSVFYTVRPGDTLDEVARHWYGDGNAALRILDANRPVLGPGMTLRPGSVIRLPVRDLG